MWLQCGGGGFLQIPVGDQPSDIERQIRGLVMDYISKPNWSVCVSGSSSVGMVTHLNM